MANFILQKNDPILKQPAAPVTESLPSDRIDEILKLMDQALAAEADGVALAAPQIGAAARLFIVSPKAFPDRQTNLIFINPKITRRSRRQVELIEGCLSARHIYGKIKRHEKVTVKAQDETGRRFTRHMSGLLAQIAQHEIDHLNGILFTDKAKDLTEHEPTL